MSNGVFYGKRKFIDTAKSRRTTPASLSALDDRYGLPLFTVLILYLHGGNAGGVAGLLANVFVRYMRIFLAVIAILIMLACATMMTFLVIMYFATGKHYLEVYENGLAGISIRSKLPLSAKPFEITYEEIKMVNYNEKSHMLVVSVEGGISHIFYLDNCKEIHDLIQNRIQK